MDASPTEAGASLQARLAGLANRRVPAGVNPSDSHSAAASLPDSPVGRSGESGAPSGDLNGSSEASAGESGTSFADLGHLLEQRSREWAAMVRELERRRQHLAFAQAEQDLACEQLGRIVPVVQDTYRSLKAAIEARQAGITGSPIDEMAAMNARALDELEKLAGTLSAQASWYRSAWEQYLQVAEGARHLRGRLG